MISERVKEELQVTDAADGNFYMEILDFESIFSHIYFVHVNLSNFSSEDNSEDLHNYNWVSKTFRGEWIEGVNSGGIFYY